MRMREPQLLGIAAVLAPIVGVLEPLGLAPLLVVTAVAALGLRLVYDRDRPWQLVPAILLLAVFAAWGLVSALWSINPPATLHKFPLLAGAFLCGIVLIDSACALAPQDRSRLGRLLSIGVALAIAIMAVERVAGFPWRHLERASWPDLHMLLISYNRGATVVALLVWPAAIALWRRRRGHAVLLVAGSLAVLAFYESGAARSAIIIGVVVAGIALLRPRVTAAVLAAGMIAYVVASPLIHSRLIDADMLGLKIEKGKLNSTIVPRSGFHRLLIWHFTSKKIEQRPLLGWGLESSRYIPGGELLLDPSEPALPLHPHNGVLQVWLEYGIPGVVLVIGLIGWMMATIRNAPWPADDKAATLALVAAAFVIINLSYGIWQGWWMAALFFAATFGVGAMPAAAARRREREAGVAFRPVPQGADAKR